MTHDPNSQSSWLSDYTEHSLSEHFSEIRTYAYLVFDQLDTNKNGYLEIEELEKALHSNLPDREKSFITFLLQNHESIGESFDENDGHNADGISRQDIEEYFKIISTLIG
jgi:hypothetical protein